MHFTSSLVLSLLYPHTESPLVFQYISVCQRCRPTSFSHQTHAITVLFLGALFLSPSYLSLTPFLRRVGEMYLCLSDFTVKTDGHIGSQL